MPRTEYSVVVVTRNRPEALALSLPLLLAQLRRPQEILVVDSSDDPSRNISLVGQLRSPGGMSLRHIISPPGMTIQRNIGLAQVKSEVVFFPDDDSLVLPGALEAMMRIYDLDLDRIVGGVCSAEAPSPPKGALTLTSSTYRMARSDRAKARIARARYAVEDRLFRDPFFYCAEKKYARLPPAPDWMQTENAILVPWMTGFRMSFRTDVVRKIGFNEQLGRYALFEDVDACFGTLQSHLIVGARRAQIYHHKAPARRANGRALGAMQLLNRAYILARAGEIDARMGRLMQRWARYKVAQYAIGARSSFGRQRLAGAIAAYRCIPALLKAKVEESTDLYLTLRSSCFETEN